MERVLRRHGGNDLLEVKADLVDRDGPLPAADAAFDVDLLPRFTEGDWLGEQKMLDWLPAEICRESGQIESSVLNGPFVRFDPSRTPNILEATRAICFHLRLEEKLVRTACGECSLG